MNNHDLFHIILRYLDKKPLDGALHDLRMCVQGKLNMTEGIRPAYAHFQKVIDFLVEKQFIDFEQRPIQNSTEYHDVSVKFGETPTASSEEANFKTAYPMAALTLDGWNYLRGLRRKQAKFRIYILTFVVAIASLVISLSSLSTKSKYNKLLNQLEECRELISQKDMQIEHTNGIISKQIFLIDSISKVNITVNK